MGPPDRAPRLPPECNCEAFSAVGPAETEMTRPREAPAAPDRSKAQYMAVRIVCRNAWRMLVAVDHDKDRRAIGHALDRRPQNVLCRLAIFGERAVIPGIDPY